jgi:hypothetical protein
VYINEKGQTLKEMHRGEESMPEFLDYPVKTRDDWDTVASAIPGKAYPHEMPEVSDTDGDWA